VPLNSANLLELPTFVLQLMSLASHSPFDASLPVYVNLASINVTVFIYIASFTLVV